MAQKIEWHGVFPAVTTQFRADMSVDVDATAKVMDALIKDGVSGLVICGTVGENCSLTTREKVEIMEAGRAVAQGRVPVICGIAEFTTAFAIIADLYPPERRATALSTWGLALPAGLLLGYAATGTT